MICYVSGTVNVINRSFKISAFASKQKIERLRLKNGSFHPIPLFDWENFHYLRYKNDSLI